MVRAGWDPAGNRGGWGAGSGARDLLLLFLGTQRNLFFFLHNESGLQEATSQIASLFLFVNSAW